MSLTGRFWSAHKLAWLGLRIGLIILLFTLTSYPAAAQVGGQMVLLAPDSSKFPIITLNFEAYNGQGSFITDLDSSQVEVIEDGTPRPLTEMSLEQPGLQLTLALNSGPTLAYTFNNISRFEQVRKVLVNWAGAQASTQDNFSLITSSGSLGSNLTDPRQFAQALEDYNPDLMKAQPGLSSLIQAMDLATDPLQRPLMKRAILFVTPMLPDTVLQALPNLADRATQLGIHLYVWLVLPNPTGDTAVSKALNDMAVHTGGQSFTLSAGSETFPDLDAYFQPLRYHYRLIYPSAIHASGDHPLSVRLKPENQALTSNEKTFSLTVLPPNPMFLAPPARIDRTWITPAGGTAQSSSNKRAVLQPESVQLKLLIEFPDGFQRPLKAARLFVDGKLVSELKQPPFDTFNWSLQGDDANTRHTLRVEVEDQLGLQSSSIDTPVEVTVAAAPALEGLRVFGLEASSLLLPAGEALGVLAIGLGGVWLFRSLRSRRKARPKRALRQAARPRQRLQMPIQIPAVRRSPARTGNAQASLMRISENGHTLPGSAVPLDYPEITIGSSPKKAAYVLASTSIDGLHARLCQPAEGQYRIYDAGSVAGTWVNYNLVPSQGACLQHGDLVQIGRETFRFELNHPMPPRKPLITSSAVDLPARTAGEKAP